MALSKQERDALGKDQFAVPSKRELPISDEEHVRLAWDMVDRTQGLTTEEKAEARSNILRKAKELGVDTKSWNKIAASAQTMNLRFESMAIEMPAVTDHPNKHPFSGVLTRLDVPSDFPVGGTTSKKVTMPTLVAEAALPSLLGMAINYTSNFDGHNRKAKIGLITAATIGTADATLGTPVNIEGFFYASDFPDEVAHIIKNKDALGFSYEAAASVKDSLADPWICASIAFTGAAVLLKDKAAFTQTSISASKIQSDKEGDIMTPEEIAAMQKRVKELEAANAALEESSKAALEAASIHNLVKPHADNLRKAAKDMLSAGIGADSKRGHVKVLNDMADRMEAQSMLGKTPSTYDEYMYASSDDSVALAAAAKLHEDEIASLKTKLADAEAKVTSLSAGKTTTTETKGERKSLSAAALQTLRKVGLEAGAEKLTVATVDKACRDAGLTMQDSMALKLNLRASGVMA